MGERHIEDAPGGRLDEGPLIVGILFVQIPPIGNFLLLPEVQCNVVIVLHLLNDQVTLVVEEGDRHAGRL